MNAQLDFMRVMDRHETRHQRRLRVLREAMASLYRAHLTEKGFDRAYVSGNDVRRWLERNPEWNAEGSANWRAAVFASKEWLWTGEMIPSTAKGGNATKIQCYRLRGMA